MARILGARHLSVSSSRKSESLAYAASTKESCGTVHTHGSASSTWALASGKWTIPSTSLTEVALRVCTRCAEQRRVQVEGQEVVDRHRLLSWDDVAMI